MVNKVLFSMKVASGDIIELVQGDRIPADGRIVASSEAQVDMSLLTGEPEPIERDSCSTPMKV